jgi:hypothetical protein
VREPPCNPDRIVWGTCAVQNEITKVRLRRLITGLGGDTQPSRGLLAVAGDAGASHRYNEPSARAAALSPASAARRYQLAASA